MPILLADIPRTRVTLAWNNSSHSRPAHGSATMVRQDGLGKHTAGVTSKCGSDTVTLRCRAAHESRPNGGGLHPSRASLVTLVTRAGSSEIRSPPSVVFAASAAHS